MMKTKQQLPAAIRTICKHDLASYQQANYVWQSYGSTKITDPYGKRCKNLVTAIDIVYETNDDTVKRLLDLVYLKRDKISIEAAADVLCIGKTTAYSMLNSVMVDYSILMGYVKPKGKKGGKVA